MCHKTTFFRNLNLDSDIPWHKTIPKEQKSGRNFEISKTGYRKQFKNFENAWEIKSKCEKQQMGAYNTENDEGIPKLASEFKSDNI